MNGQGRAYVKLIGPDTVTYGFVEVVDEMTPVYVEINPQRRATYHLDGAAQDGMPVYQFQGYWEVTTLPLKRVPAEQIVTLE